LSDLCDIKFDKKFAPATKTIPASKNTIMASDPNLYALLLLYKVSRLNDSFVNVFFFFNSRSKVNRYKKKIPD
jgi:hypothetical protein